METPVSSPWSRLRGIQPLSLCDWPGHTSCVLFLGGCNLRCPTCHNMDMAFHPDWLPPVRKQEVVEYLDSRKRWLEGIVVSGGEPTCTPDIESLLRELRQFGLPLKLDTNGMLPGVVETLLEAGLVDEFFVDVKGPYAKYPLLTGNRADAAAARHNLARIFALAEARPQAFVFRLTKVPALDAADISEAKSYLPQGFMLRLQNYQEPRRVHAQIDSETGRLSGDVVDGAHRTGHFQSAEGQRRQRPPVGQAACA